MPRLSTEESRLLRKATRRMTEAIGAMTDPDNGMHFGDGPELEEFVPALNELVMAALPCLPDPDRAIIMMRYMAQPLVVRRKKV